VRHISFGSLFLKGSEKTTHHTSLDKERQSQLKLLRSCILAEHTSAYVSTRRMLT
jgi:hypothetical protein